METVGLVIRKSIITRIQEEIEKSCAYFFIGFNKVDSAALSKLRNELRVTNSYVFVAKNSLIRKSFESQNLDGFKDYLEGETGVIFICQEDIVGPCKVIVEFSKENENILIKGGVVDSKKITKEGLESLAKLPAREVLLGQAVSGLASPLTGFVACLNQIILKFAWALEEIKKVKGLEPAKDKSGEAKEPAKADSKDGQASEKIEAADAEKTEGDSGPEPEQPESGSQKKEKEEESKEEENNKKNKQSEEG